MEAARSVSLFASANELKVLQVGNPAIGGAVAVAVKHA